MTDHREIPVKVTAWIDEGAAPVVAALNDLPNVVTLDSCQADPDTGRGRVAFGTYPGYDLLAKIVNDLRNYLPPGVAIELWDDRARTDADGNPPVAELTWPPGAAGTVAAQIRQFTAARMWATGYTS